MSSSMVQVKFGSHLYGTATAASDVDIKTVFVPPAREILLQRINEHQSNRMDKPQGIKNNPGDIDYEAFALHRYLAMLAEGRPLALDILFAPPSAWIERPMPMWHAIVHNRSRLISRQINRFITYCYTQANKYGIKGSRIHAVRSILTWFDQAIADHGTSGRLTDAADSLRLFIIEQRLQHTEITMIGRPGAPAHPHLNCCGLKAGFAIKLECARAIYQRLMDRYGTRALLAEINSGVDWKAISHAVRISHQAIQLLGTGHIDFPRPEAAHLLAIKLGELPYTMVADEIEDLLDRVQQAQATSSLPDHPDHAFIDQLICEIYGDQVRSLAK